MGYHVFKFISKTGVVVTNAFSFYDVGTDQGSCSGIVNGVLSRSGARNDVRSFFGITGGCD